MFDRLSGGRAREINATRRTRFAENRNSGDDDDADELPTKRALRMPPRREAPVSGDCMPVQAIISVPSSSSPSSSSSSSSSSHALLCRCNSALICVTFLGAEVPPGHMPLMWTSPLTLFQPGFQTPCMFTLTTQCQVAP